MSEYDNDTIKKAICILIDGLKEEEANKMFRRFVGEYPVIPEQEDEIKAI